MPLALYTFGQFIERAEHEANDSFRVLNDQIFQNIEHADGLIARSGYASDPGPETWGPEIYPTFYVERGDGWSPATLSLWEDIETLFAFTYFGLHAIALKRGSEWFRKPKWPPLVLWWHRHDTPPTWAQGVEKHQFLHANGPTAQAFTFKMPFDKNDQPTKVDKLRVQTLRRSMASGDN
ncbi:MAG: DUF3291 domain-containing protein [Rhodobacteraceae bacterium]|nr:DUF3291 domain-containing protein [Paracoccaceae bacterium]